MDKNIIDLKSTTFSGKRFTRKQLAQIQETVTLFPGLSRRELAHTICEHLNWHTPKGVDKIQSCLTALEQMEKVGLFILPAKQKRAQTTYKKITWTDRTKKRPPIHSSLSELGSISIKKVTQKKDIELWNEYVDRYHYLGYKRPIGSHLRYFIVSKKQNDEILGCLLFSATAVRALSCRDEWIGWGKKDRSKRLNLILNNGRFLIFPWVNVKFLASKCLSIISRQIINDWNEWHGYRPVLLETFVNPAEYEGTSYKAANWRYLGETSGRNWSKSTDKKNSPKDTYVYPLRPDFREILKNEKSSKNARQQTQKKGDKSATDDLFIQLWQNIADIVFNVTEAFDKKWQKRKRVIDTMLIVFFIFRLVFSKNKQGYTITIIEMWDQFRKMNYPLPQPKPVAPSALCNARKKLDENIFKELNTKILSCYEDTAEDYRWKQHRIFAVDGTKINLPRKLLSSGYKLPSNNSNYPQGLVSCLYQLKSKLPYDFDLSSHTDERALALAHMKCLRRNDIVVYDRGYFSYIMLHSHIEQEIHAIFRIQKNSFTVIKEFRNSNETEKVVPIMPSIRTQRDIIAQNPDMKIIPLELRLIKYTMAGETYVLGTTLLDRDIYKTEAFPDLYHSRWGVEELYKISKILINVEDFHSHTERGVKQELFAHFTLISMNRIFANQAENGLFVTDNLSPYGGEPEASSKFKVNFKNALVVIARSIEGLFIQKKKFVERTIRQIFVAMCACTQKERPGRSYERKSMKPMKKWATTKS